MNKLKIISNNNELKQNIFNLDQQALYVSYLDPAHDEFFYQLDFECHIFETLQNINIRN